MTCGYSGKIKKIFSSLYKAVPEELWYILAIFISTRIILTIIGSISRLSTRGGDYFSFTDHIWLNVWGVFDSGWYVGIADHWYSGHLSANPATLNQGDIAFFPLYPLLMKLLGGIIGNTYIAGLVISNVSLLVACYFVFKLISLDSDRSSAKKAVKYLILFPTGFILSGVFTESLYIAIIVMCFYFARKDQWLLVGILGFLLALTRSIGCLVIVPLIFEYLALKGFKLENIKLNLLCLLLVPAGVALFSVYNYYLTGDFLAFVHIQSSWGRSHISNPVSVLFHGLFSKYPEELFWAYFTLISILILILGYNKLRFSYLLVGIYTIGVPLCSSLISMPRYVLTAFPLYIALANLTKDKRVDWAVTIFFFIAQCVLMAAWAAGSPMVM